MNQIIVKSSNKEQNNYLKKKVQKEIPTGPSDSYPYLSMIHKLVLFINIITYTNARISSFVFPFVYTTKTSINITGYLFFKF